MGVSRAGVRGRWFLGSSDKKITGDCPGQDLPSVLPSLAWGREPLIGCLLLFGIFVFKMKGKINSRDFVLGAFRLSVLLSFRPLALAVTWDGRAHGQNDVTSPVSPVSG